MYIGIVTLFFPSSEFDLTYVVITYWWVLLVFLAVIMGMSEYVRLHWEMWCDRRRLRCFQEQCRLRKVVGRLVYAQAHASKMRGKGKDASASAADIIGRDQRGHASELVKGVAGIDANHYAGKLASSGLSCETAVNQAKIKTAPEDLIFPGVCVSGAVASADMAARGIDDEAMGDGRVLSCQSVSVVDNEGPKASMGVITMCEAGEKEDCVDMGAQAPSTTASGAPSEIHDHHLLQLPYQPMFPEAPMVENTKPLSTISCSPRTFAREDHDLGSSTSKRLNPLAVDTPATLFNQHTSIATPVSPDGLSTDGDSSFVNDMSIASRTTSFPKRNYCFPRYTFARQRSMERRRQENEYDWLEAKRALISTEGPVSSCGDEGQQHASTCLPLNEELMPRHPTSLTRRRNPKTQ